MSRVRVTCNLVLSGISLLAKGRSNWLSLLTSLGVRLLLSLPTEAVRTRPRCRWVVLLRGVSPILLSSRPTTSLTCTIPVGRLMRLVMPRLLPLRGTMIMPGRLLGRLAT